MTVPVGVLNPANRSQVSTQLGIFNVREFQAIGDGVSDDSAAFQQALNTAQAFQEYFGTTIVAAPTVIVPSVVSPSGSTASYLITQTLVLCRGLLFQGQGSQGALLQFKPANNNSTLLYFVGTAEGQNANIIIQNLFFFQNANVMTSIGLRLRNFGYVQVHSCTFSNFAVALWADWGQDIDCFETSFTQNARGVQLGGNLAQTATPVPPAGIRHAPLAANPWLDNCAFFFCKFSQNVLDVNHMGSSVSHGNTLFLNCTFFESATSPVAGKTQFIHATLLKGLNVTSCWFEEGNNTRTCIQLDTLDFDGNTGGVCAGALIAGNHFLMTAATGIIGVNVLRATGCVIQNNVFEMNFGGTTTGISLQDSVNTTRVEAQSWMSYPDGEIVANLPNGAIVVGTSPPGGHVLDHIGPSLGTPTYSASIAINAAQEVQEITATNATAFAIQVPTRPRSGFLVITIFNNSGGALGVATWTGGAGGFILTGGAWTQPANGLRRDLVTRYSQTKNAWVEVSRSGADY